MSTTVEPRPHRVVSAMSAVSQLKAWLAEQAAGGDVDAKLELDSIEGMTDALEVMDAYAELILQDKLFVEIAEARAKRLKARAEKRRAKVLQMMETIGHKSIQRPTYTATLSYRQKPLVTDADLLPPEFTRTQIDLVKLGKALRREDVAGATLSNPIPTLTLTHDRRDGQPADEEQE